MIPTIIVFVHSPSTEKESKLISNLLGEGYSPLVDANHGTDWGWFKQNTDCPHRLFRFNGCCDIDFPRLYEETDEEDDLMKIDMMVAFNKDEEVNHVQWEYILTWACGMMECYCGEQIQKLDFLEKPVIAPVVQELKNTDMLGEDPEIVTYPDCYGFRQVFHDGVGFYEITKPNTDRPYTTYIEDYRHRERDLFSNFFICTSWGVAKEDIGFLGELWKWKMLDGEEFDCEKLVKERVDRCVNGEPEPKVYRRVLEEVMEKYFEVKESVGQKRKGMNGESSDKRFAQEK